jgi:hypothetical protein
MDDLADFNAMEGMDMWITLPLTSRRKCVIL